MGTQERAAGYARISMDRSGESVGVERQTDDIRKMAASRGLDLTAVYSDNDISALSGALRPGYQELLSAVRSGEVQTVVAWQTSRLWRNRRERAEAIELFSQRRIKVLAVKGPEIDFSTAYGRAMAGLLGEFDTMESEVKSERVAAASAAAARGGKFRGGFRPFGYTADGLTLVPEEAELIRDAYRSVLSGGSLHSIARNWNERGVPTTRGNKWNHSAIRFLLKNSRNAGLSEYKGEIVGPGQWPAIVDESTWRAVTAILSNPARRKSQDSRVRWLVSGMAVCSTCDGPVFTSGAKAGAIIYRCSTGAGGHAYQRAAEVDRTLTESTIFWLCFTDVRETMARLAVGPDVDVAGLTARVSAERTLLAEVADAFGDGELSRSDYVRQREKILARLKAAEDALRRASSDELLSEAAEWPSIEEGWYALDIERRRALLRRFFEPIKIYPARHQPSWTVLPNPEFPQHVPEIAAALSSEA